MVYHRAFTKRCIWRGWVEERGMVDFTPDCVRGKGQKTAFRRADSEENAWGQGWTRLSCSSCNSSPYITNMPNRQRYNNTCLAQLNKYQQKSNPRLFELDPQHPPSLVFLTILIAFIISSPHMPRVIKVRNPLPLLDPMKVGACENKSNGCNRENDSGGLNFNMAVPWYSDSKRLKELRPFKTACTNNYQQRV